MNYKTFVTAATIIPEGEPIFSERTTTIRIEDEAGGCFLIIRQDGKIHTPGENQICLDAAEWPKVKDAIEMMFDNCREIDRWSEREKPD